MSGNDRFQNYVTKGKHAVSRRCGLLLVATVQAVTGNSAMIGADARPSGKPYDENRTLTGRTQ
jgi:hypothetical protein